jgi:hypothetical protein
MNHLLNAIQKCAHQCDDQWGGYLQPKEILALNDIVSIDKHYVEIAVDWKRNGLSGGRWVYFNANEKFQEMKGRHCYGTD